MSNHTVNETLPPPTTGMPDGMAEGFDPNTLFLYIGALMFIGFVGNLIFSKLRFNDTLLLIALGVVLGPIMNIIEPDAVDSARVLVGPLALILILFDGGLALRFSDLLHGLASASIMAVVGFTASMFGIAVVVMVMLDIPFLTALILGAILAGTSALVVMPSLQYIKTEPRTATTLNLESALTDVLVVVVAFTLMSIVGLGQGSGASGFIGSLASVFGGALFVGSLVGVLWLLLLPALRDRPFSYMLTLGVMFLLYWGVETTIGSQVGAGGGPLAVLAFGIILGNVDRLGRSLRERVGDQFMVGMRRFQGEISFIVRTFFFVYLGILIDPMVFQSVSTWVTGGLIFAAMILARYLAVAATQRQIFLKGDSFVLMVMMPRGLAAAVLAAAPASAPYHIPGTEAFVSLAVLILVLSNVLSTGGALLLSTGSGGRRPKRMKPPRRKKRRGRKSKKSHVPGPDEYEGEFTQSAVEKAERDFLDDRFPRRRDPRRPS